MSNLISLSRPALLTRGKITVLVSVDTDVVHQLIAWAVGHTDSADCTVTVIDCRCSFNATRVLELIHLEHIYFKQAMDNIQVSRPFTAYQYQASTNNLLQKRPPPNSPIVIMSALHLLYDDNIQLGESMRLLRCLLADFQRLCQRAPLTLTVALPPADMKAKLCLLNALTTMADQVIAPETSVQQAPFQQRLLI